MFYSTLSHRSSSNTPSCSAAILIQNRESPIRASEIIQSPETRHALESVSSDVMSLHESFYTAPSAMDEIESVTGSTLGDEGTELDTILINTTLYKKAFKSRIKTQKEAIRETGEVDGTAATVSDMPFEPGPSGSTSRGEFATTLMQDSLPHVDATDRISIYSQSSANTVKAAVTKGEDNESVTSSLMATVESNHSGPLHKGSGTNPETPT